MGSSMNSHNTAPPLMSLQRSLVVTFTSSLLFLMASLLAAAPAAPVLFAGRVVDSSGAPVPAAHVIAEKGGTVPPASAVSDRDGHFTMALQPDAYVVHVERKRFTEIAQRVDVLPGDSSEHLFVLQI